MRIQETPSGGLVEPSPDLGLTGLMPDCGERLSRQVCGVNCPTAGMVGQLVARNTRAPSDELVARSIQSAPAWYGNNRRIRPPSCPRRIDAREAESPIGLPEPSWWPASVKTVPRWAFPGFQRFEKHLEVRRQKQANEFITCDLRVVLARRHNSDAVTALVSATRDLNVTDENSHVNI